MFRLTAACALAWGVSSAAAFVPLKQQQQPLSSFLCMKASDERESGFDDRRSFVTKSATTAVATAAATLTTTTALPPQPAQAATSMWEQVPLPFDDTLYDIGFDTPDHGYLVGAKGTFAETTDGGKTWEPRSFANLDPEEEVTYRFSVVSFKDGEGWILGKPTLMLHTKDAGKSWERIPLSPKLPGEPTAIVALGPGAAEMTTSSGAVYTTDNAGRNWKARVKETIDATLNRISSSGISGASYFTGSIVQQVRDDNGAYLAVSSRGTFFLTWEPGDDFWIPHNRGTPRRIQNMGYINGEIKKGLWMSLNGGKLLLSPGEPDLTADSYDFVESDIKTAGYGITDVGFKTDDEVWAVGGSNTMYVSFDGGKKFGFDKSANDIPGNLYSVKFVDGKGWALGSNGLLLRYTG